MREHELKMRKSTGKKCKAKERSNKDVVRLKMKKN